MTDQKRNSLFFSNNVPFQLSYVEAINYRNGHVIGYDCFISSSLAKPVEHMHDYVGKWPRTSGKRRFSDRHDAAILDA